MKWLTFLCYLYLSGDLEDALAIIRYKTSLNTKSNELCKLLISEKSRNCIYLGLSINSIYITAAVLTFNYFLRIEGKLEKKQKQY